MVNEEILHTVWKYRLYDPLRLKTCNGESVEVLYPGIHNTDAGPDFTNAKIKIGDTLWVGNVEIHLREEDWYAHGHHSDAAYNNTILHVVYSTRNKSTKARGENTINTVALEEAILPTVTRQYYALMRQKKPIPCSGLLDKVDDITIRFTIERMVMERLEQKVNALTPLLERYRYDWEQVFYIYVTRYLGAEVNKEPMQWLAERVPVKLIAKHADQLIQIEALLFGASGMLEHNHNDDYPRLLRKEFLYLKRLHHIVPLDYSVWKFLRLRPPHFPTLRIAQLAALLHSRKLSFAAILACSNVNYIKDIFNVKTSEYWHTHYMFDKAAHQTKCSPGESVVHLIAINAVAPVLFAYGKYKGDEDICDRAVQLLQGCKPENNRFIRQWEEAGIHVSNASDTQGLLQLRQNYCNKLKCLQCGIGIQILKSG
ncbi:MAG: DUF2851 family protein [Chitinophagales bacterium]|nr:DUF2851 family protein [Chitinophagales bacterium]MDW8418951.1 DUF2851 family protein [Chitinophagales bacterium]